MCGRYGFSIVDEKAIASRYHIDNPSVNINWQRFNIAPGQINPTIVRHSPNSIELMFWGLIPAWARDDSFKFKTINAREEGIEDKPTYKKPFRFQRCLIPASFFYEWDKSQKPSQPYVFKVKGRDMFSFAGLYDIWNNKKTNETIHSYTIITTQANELVSKVHPRMPVILKEEDEDEWLNPDYTEPEQLHQFLYPYPANLMEAYPVSTAVNFPNSDSNDLINPLK